MKRIFNRDIQYYKFCAYGFLKNLRFFEPFLILFFLENGQSFFQIGILYAVREIVRNIFEIPAGMLADAYGRRRTMIVSFTFYIISFLLFFFSDKFALFIMAMCVFSFGEAFRTGTHKAMIFEYLKIKGWLHNKVDYYGHTRSWSQIGSAISALLAGLIVLTSGRYDLIFIYSAIPYLLDLFLMLSYPKILDGDIRIIKKQGFGSIFKNVFKDFMSSFKDIQVLRAIANVSIFSGYFRALKDYLQPLLNAFAISIPLLLFLKDDQRTAVIVGLVYFIIYVLTSFSSRKSGYLAAKFDKLQKPLNLSLLIGLLAGTISGALYLGNVLLLSIIFYIGIYIIENIRKPIGVAYVTEVLKKDVLATALSVESQVKTLFSVVIALLTGYLADQLGIGYALIIVSGIVLIISPLFLLKSNLKT